MVRALFAFLFLFAAPAFALCQTNLMQFVAFPPDTFAEKILGHHGWTIYVAGEIDADASKRLAALVAEKRIPLGSSLYLHSSGGSLVGGMALGRVIRENRLQTYIGQFNPASRFRSNPGYCYSACALAFRGGEKHFLYQSSLYGVHRFFWKQHSDNDADVAQIISSAVVEYIRSMDVDTKLFALASQGSSSEIITPSLETLLALNVINNGRKPVKWTIESITGAMYLKGEQETANGINKFMLVCPAGGAMGLYAIFDAGQNAEEVMTFPVNWLFLNGKKVRIDNRLVQKENHNGMINLVYRLDPSLLAAIAQAKRVGVGLQVTTETAIFNGFDDMPFEGGAVKLSGFQQVCHRSR